MTVTLTVPDSWLNDTPPEVLSPGDPRLFSTGAVIGAANRAVSCRVIARRSGFLRDMLVGVVSASGNIDVGIYDTGDTTTTVRTKLGSSGSIACPVAWTSAAPAVAWDPGAGVIPIVAGRQYDLFMACDNNTASFFRYVNGGIPTFPTAYWTVPGAALPKLTTVIATSFPLPSTFAEAALTAQAYLPLIMGRISST